MKKPKVIFEAKYKKGAYMLNEHDLPRLRHVNPDFYVDACEISAIGNLDDGREFCDMRVYLKESNIKSSET